VVNAPSQLGDRANVTLWHPREEGQRTQDFAPIALSRPIPGSPHQHLERGALTHVAGSSCRSHPSEAIRGCIALQRPANVG
jgi:hypothetical protein